MTKKLFIAAAVWLVSSAAVALPDTYQKLKKPVSNKALAKVLKKAAKQPHIQVGTAGSSVKGKPIHVVNIKTGDAPNWRILLHAQQHGDETSGKDALTYLIRDLAEQPSLLPENIDLWIVPQVNPDGAKANTRNNANNKDLNRDHLLLSQPETQALHAVARQVNPHIVVDSHEFRRDTQDYLDQGWKEWPLLMADVSTNPLYHPELATLGQQWVTDLGHKMAEQDIAFSRYFIAYNPPNGEFRYSTMQPDDARNAMGLFYHSLSFIVEAGKYHEIKSDKKADLRERVNAYYQAYLHLINSASSTPEALTSIEAAKAAPILHANTPTHYFWGSQGLKGQKSKAVEIASGNLVEFAVPNFMDTPVVRHRIVTPRAYLVKGKAVALIEPLLQRHQIGYGKIAKPHTVNQAESCQLDNVVEGFDSRYQQPSSMQLVSCQKRTDEIQAEEGDLFVTVSANTQAQISAILEPQMRQGLLQYPAFRTMVGNDKQIPIIKVYR